MSESVWDENVRLKRRVAELEAIETPSPAEDCVAEQAAGKVTELMDRVAELEKRLEDQGKVLRTALVDGNALGESALAKGKEVADLKAKVAELEDEKEAAVAELADSKNWARRFTSRDTMKRQIDELQAQLVSSNDRAEGAEIRVIELECITNGWDVETYVSAGVETYAVVRNGKRWAEFYERTDAERFVMHKAQLDSVTKPRQGNEDA